jgi:hypothetical protein
MSRYLVLGAFCCAFYRPTIGLRGYYSLDVDATAGSSRADHQCDHTLADESRRAMLQACMANRVSQTQGRFPGGFFSLHAPRELAAHLTSGHKRNINKDSTNKRPIAVCDILSSHSTSRSGTMEEVSDLGQLLI